MLQMWRDADDPDRAVVLFAVNDRAKAEAWIGQQTALKGAAAAQFLRTA